VTVRRLAIVALLAAALVAAAAAVLGTGLTPPPQDTPLPVVKTVAPGVLVGAPQRLARDSATRAAQQLTLRVRNISCAGVATGSGFALDEHTIITNRHVVEGAAALELNAWDGASIDADVDQASTARLVDIAATRVEQPLPTVAELGPDPEPNQRVTAVGYPLGGPLTASPGRVVRVLDGNSLPAGFAFDGQVLEVSAKIKQGNSGGPLLDRRGRVVGVVFAGRPGATLEDFMQAAYAIPISSMEKLLSLGGQQAITPCA
jgi:S1-C subfamily serine protease